MQKNITIIIAAISLFICSCNRANKTVSIDYVSVPVLSTEEMRAIHIYANDKHLEEAVQSKIKTPIKDKETFYNNEEDFCDKYNLKKIENNKLYNVARLSHSIPYVNKKTENFLELLGERMEDSFKEKGLDHYRFVLTSVLRTKKDQQQLQKLNINATPNVTSHYFGTTFDISQTRFVAEKSNETVYSYRLRNILARELIRLQEEDKCYVLIENREKCFHITVKQ